MKKIAIPLTILVALLVTSSFSFASPGGQRNGKCDGHGHRSQAMTYEQHKEQMENRLERMGVVLDLTTGQKDQLKNIFDQQWTDRQALRAEMQANRDALQAAKQSDNFNEQEFRAQARKHADLKTDMMVERNKVHQQVLAILTPEQQKKMEQMRNMMGQNRGHHKGMGHGKNRCFNSSNS